MTNDRFKPYKKLHSGTQENQLLVADVVRYLSRLAKLYEEDKTGNLEMGKGLQCVARALRPYSDCSVLELTEVIKRKTPSSDNRNTRSVRARSTKTKFVLPDALEDISQKDIEIILDNDGYTKLQVVELGFRRFGISRSKLVRLSKKDAQDSIRAALEHEKSLDVISNEALRGGKARSA